MKALTSFGKTLMVVAAACVLAACGSDHKSHDDAPALDVYLGSWSFDDGCEQGGLVLARTGNKLYEINNLMTIDKEAGDLRLRMTTMFYEDPQCSVKVGSKEEVYSLHYQGKGDQNLGDGRQVTADRFRIHWLHGALYNDETGESVQMASDYSTDRDYQVAGFVVRAGWVDFYLLSDEGDDDLFFYRENDWLHYIFADDDGTYDIPFHRN